MNLKEWLASYNVTTTYASSNTIFSNLENVIDKEVWICDYRLGNDKLGKPIRNISPKLVKVFNIDDAKKRIYYTPVFFKEIKNGKITSAEIAPYDNTGYRGRTGVSVNIFNTKEECLKCYKGQLLKAKDELEKVFTNVKSQFNEKMNFIESELFGNK